LLSSFPCMQNGLKDPNMIKDLIGNVLGGLKNNSPQNPMDFFKNMTENFGQMFKGTCEAKSEKKPEETTQKSEAPKTEVQEPPKEVPKEPKGTPDGEKKDEKKVEKVDEKKDEKPEENTDEKKEKVEEESLEKKLGEKLYKKAVELHQIFGGEIQSYVMMVTSNPNVPVEILMNHVLDEREKDLELYK